jgi:hypothetical protein
MGKGNWVRRERARGFGAAMMRASVLALLCAGGGVVSGCAVSESDVTRWEGTEHGPYKLVAVVTHDKYSWPLRTKAAVALAEMPPRGGQRKGISFLIDKYKDDEGEEREGALAVLPEDARRQIVNGMAPTLMEKMKQPAPKADKDGRLPPDPSVPYKDVAFAMLSHEPTLISDDKTKTDITNALIDWGQSDFENRLENGSQQFGLEQMMRFIGASSVKKLPSFINEDAYRVDRMSGLVADIGDDDTKKRAGDALVALAKVVNSPKWADARKKEIVDHNNASGVKATDAQVGVQLTQMTDRKLNEEIFPAMKKVGGRAIIDYLLGYAADKNNSDDRRKTALAALEGRVDKNNPQDLQRVFDICKDDSVSDAVKDVAFQRLAEFPKEQIVPKLWTLFDPKKWKIRWVAAELVLKTETTKDVPEFMRHLPTKSTQKMGMTEGLTYGQQIAKMDAPAGQPKPIDTIRPYLNSPDIGPRLTAIGFFYQGKKTDQGMIAGQSEDKTPLPKCDKDDDCQWQCDVPKASNPKETESKEIATIGELVKLCVLPSMDQK